MFGFDESKLTPQQVIALAESQGLSPLRVAIESNGYRHAQSFWENPQEVDDSEGRYPTISLGTDQDVVGNLSRNIARSVQFPESSAYMHFVGCVSAAMLGRFTVEYHGTDQPTALYVVTSQPPSTGKSAINALATAPMVAEVERINEQRKSERKKVLSKLSRIAKELKMEKPPSEIEMLMGDKEDLEEKLEKLADITFPVSDTTPEGLAKVNNRQGSFAVISDEATSVNSLLGMTYGDSSKKANSELVLKAWDAGNVSIARSNVDNNMSFVALGCIAVIAQDETIDAIMNAGSRGIGVSERFLLIRERSFLGERVFIDEDGNSTYEEVDKGLKADYYRMVHEIMSEHDVKLTVAPDALRLLNRARQEMEPDLGDGGKYSHTMLRGALGKFDKQTTRLAAVIHTIRNWSHVNGRAAKEREISLETMQEAIMMFHELSKTYLSSASNAGHAGDAAEVRKLLELVMNSARKTSAKGVVMVRSLIENARKVKPFTGQSGVSTRITDSLLPMLEQKGYVCVIKDRVYVNPKLLG